MFKDVHCGGFWQCDNQETNYLGERFEERADPIELLIFRKIYMSTMCLLS